MSECWKGSRGWDLGGSRGLGGVGRRLARGESVRCSSGAKARVQGKWESEMIRES